MIDLQISLVGFVIGILVGLTGVGGGVLMTPLLIVFCGVRPVVAVGTDLVYASLTKWVGALQHLRQKTVNVSFAMWLGMGSVPGSIAGALGIGFLNAADVVDVDLVVKRVLGIVLILIGAVIALDLAVKKKRRRPKLEMNTLTTKHKIGLVGLGVVIGFLVGMTSVGSGTLTMLILLMVFRAPLGTLVGTDIFHGALLVTSAAVTHVMVGTVDFALVGSLVIGSIPGVLIGSRLVVSIPQHVLRGTLGAVLVLAGLKLI